MFRVVPEGRCLEPCPCLVTDAGGHVERVPGHGARRAANHVAVGVIAKRRIGRTVHQLAADGGELLKSGVAGIN